MFNALTQLIECSEGKRSLIKYYSINKKEISLVVISSVLLGIWATMNTIALRNVLLWVGGLIALIYWWDWLKTNKANNTLPSLSWLYWLPVILIGLMFAWVVIHYFFFAQNPQQQFSELKSTWLRSFLAAIIGSATGLALNRNNRLMPLLWLGLLLSFIVLIYQYIPKAIVKQSLFATDFFGDYIYWAKFSGVLAGTILIAGLLGLLIDSLWQNNRKESSMKLKSNANVRLSGNLADDTTRIFTVEENQRTSSQSIIAVKAGLVTRIAIPIYVFGGICVAAYSFVFIFDAKAGVGMTFILIAFWLGIGLLFVIKRVASDRDKKRRRAFLIKSLIVLILIAASLFWFTTKHIKNNPGWGSLFEDIALSAQIDTYQYWKGTGVALPLRKDGSPVAGNTYERVALATLGMRLIVLNRVGNGSLRSFKEDAKKIDPNYNNHHYTHSAWIDLGLSFGLPGLLFLPIALFSLLLCAVVNPRIRFRATIITIAIVTLILYLVGEYAFQHGVEILFYLLGLLCGLALVDYSKARELQA
jgi:hypothetical protein